MDLCKIIPGCAVILGAVGWVVGVSWGLTWDFDRENDLMGWRWYGSAFQGGGTPYGMRVQDGALVLPIREDPKYFRGQREITILSPLLECDTVLFDRCRMRLRLSEGTSMGWITFEWRTSDTPWIFPYDDEVHRAGVGKLVWTDAWEDYEITGFVEKEGWKGTLIQFSLTIVFWGYDMDEPLEVYVPNAVLIDSIVLTGAGEELLGEPSLPGERESEVGFLVLDQVYPLDHGARLSGMDVDRDGDMDLLSIGGLSEERFLMVLYI